VKLAAKLSDGQLALTIGVFLFVAVAWPLCFLHVPPYQDLPGHLAAVTILANLDQYPEFVGTGFLKPNSILFLFTLGFGRWLGTVGAAKLFSLLTLAANALVLPRFVLHFTDRKRMLIATPFLVPMVHNWFVSMGMLNFAISVPVAFLLIMALDDCLMLVPRAQLRAAGLALLSWYLHPIPVVIIGLMVAATIAPDLLERSFHRARAILPPFAPAALAALFVLVRHVGASASKMEAPVFSPPYWALYNIWGQWMYGFTELTAVSLVPAIVLVIIAIVRFRNARGLLGPVPLVVLLLAYMHGPYVALDANYITPRFIPFLWAAALVRLPERLPRALHALLGLSTAAYLGGMPIDLFRLSRELDEFAAGTPAVAEHAQLLPLNFNPRPTSKNTFSLAMGWGLYVVERQTSAIDAWANVPSMPIMLRKPLPPHLEPIKRLRFVRDTRSPEIFCAVHPAPSCGEESWRAEWERFWQEQLPSFDHILLWDPPKNVVDTVPSNFTESFVKGRVHIFKRVP
jgi:hypothetical protein